MLQIYWIDLYVTEMEDDSVTLTGNVTGLDLAGLPISIGGVADDSVTTDENGAFTITTTVSELGDITATLTDLWGNASNTATVAFTQFSPQRVVNYYVWSLRGGIEGNNQFGSLAYCVRNINRMREDENVRYRIYFVDNLTRFGNVIRLQDELVVNHDMTIQGNTDQAGVPLITICPADDTPIRLFKVEPGKTCYISNLILVDGDRPNGYGGAIWNVGNLTLENVRIRNCEARRGAGILRRDPSS